MILSGKELSATIKEQLKKDIQGLTTPPHLVTILVGDNPASKVYVANKEKACKEVGIKNTTEIYPTEITEEDLLDIVEIFNTDPNVDGILVQLPLPPHIDTNKVICAINPNKDVDGFHPNNVSKLWLGQDCIKPCTPQGIIELIDSTGIDLKGKNVVVVGRSNIVGLPISKLCLDRNATVTIAHSKTKNLATITSEADVLIVAIGKPNFITYDMVKCGAIVIDVGINRVQGKICGDVDFESVKCKASYITPVPCGVGPMTIASLLKNTLMCYLNNR